MSPNAYCMICPFHFGRFALFISILFDNLHLKSVTHTLLHNLHNLYTCNLVLTLQISKISREYSYTFYTYTYQTYIIHTYCVHTLSTNISLLTTMKKNLYYILQLTTTYIPKYFKQITILFDFYNING